jgi:hypothetical protein
MATRKDRIYMKHSHDYIYKKVFDAVTCLCGSAPDKQRLEDATIGALIRLHDEDLEGEFKEDLEYIFRWTKWNIKGQIQREPDAKEWNQLVQKMLSVMKTTTELIAERSAAEKVRRIERDALAKIQKLEHRNATLSEALKLMGLRLKKSNRRPRRK